MSAFFYKVVYGLGFTPWERLETFPAAKQITAMFDREEHGRQPPFGAALDVGCGTGVWSVRLATRGWQVTGIDLVSRAVNKARERARQAGVEARFIQADATALRDAGVGSNFRLVLDFGTVHGLGPDQRVAAGREISAVAAPDATLLMYALAPGRRGVLPSGMDRGEIERIYPGWKVIDEVAFDPSGMPESARKSDPRWYRLRRVAQT